ncbi:MAG: hypothetical protein A2887_01545 [Alphaproteobacteria bacterium RIFCSPLOWO2_01_FULL_40_26]|nr:MAG: hypothetical protein A3D15_05345 [Alphaproteobacteria bacterium RIFCSPHIGHO2_02_FULL_40_34]OFW88318.1 MAG: hypothetical protein A2794_04905 [Alphaproteobacteria bacterium RIFCSPHIGHO2_01_FULL_40_8]OFW94967.1 MAG: hypothetical protein A2887_01545 [Alphaproteobacteria bacterium RIFCSPLOWO2_01_FULL_40_26]OFX09886.1 MAG: hypothetical protein A3H30_06045 [Alphaproteobacteria bacterium RIFCSPLOWO2_02_FULL_40_19]OFX10935.1 MAG: hypothetical protein A3G22_02195 [Alphaproteobacteria bacterium RI
MKKSFLLLPFFFLLGCAIGNFKRESPVIYFSNASFAPIKNITCEWAGHVLTLPALNPGDSRSQSFYLSSAARFFGLVKLSWTNDDGEIVRREFFFKENNLPSFDDPTTYNYVQLYFDQHGMEIISSDAPDLTGKTQKMDQLLAIYHEKYLKGHKPSDDNALISVKPVKDNSLPNWLATSY